MVNILHIINTLAPSGAETLLMNFAANFKEPNYKIYIAYIYGDGELLNEYDFNNNVEIFNLTHDGKFSFFSIFKLINIIKSRKIDIVHTHLVYAGILGKLAAKICHVKHIVTTRHYGFLEDENKFLYQIEQLLTRYSSTVIAISNTVKNYLLDQNVISEEKIVVIHNAIDLEMFDNNKKQVNNAVNNILTIGSIGRLVPQKDFKTLLESFKIILKQFSNLNLEIIGDGILRNELENYAAKLKIAKNVLFTGTLPYQLVLNRIPKWDLFILSSSWEGLGIAVIEAMTFEKAVVATNVAGFVEVVDDGITGYLVPPKSPDVLARKVIDLLLNENKRLEMGKLGRQKVEKQFSIKEFNEKTKQVYSDLM